MEESLKLSEELRNNEGNVSSLDLEKENSLLLHFQISNIRNNFISLGLPAFGELKFDNLIETEKTINCFSEILLQKHREIQMKNDFLEKFRRIESELSYCKGQNEKILIQKNAVEKELKNCLNKYALLEKNTKEQIEKFIAEKEELNKQIAKFQSRETQFIHEIRKKDLLFSNLQEQLKKVQKEKNLAYSNNNIMCQNSSQISKKEEDLNIFYSYDGFQNLANENEKLKEFLFETFTNLNEIFENKRNTLMKNYLACNHNNKNDNLIQSLKNFQLLNLKDYNYKILSAIKLNEILEVFNENIRRLKQFFLIFQESSNSNDLILNDNEFENQLNNIKNTNELKEIIKNYKCLATNQEELLNSIVFVKTEFSENYGKNLEYRSNVLDETILNQKRKELNSKKMLLMELQNLKESSKKKRNDGFQEETTMKLEEKENLGNFLNFVV